MVLGVMGHMLALNTVRNGICVAGYDIDAEKVKNFNLFMNQKSVFVKLLMRIVNRRG